ncbi:MAG: zinc ABC transporter substrate-binding protein [Schwartzia sp.]|nr:zinc ABC transporter substrate-binding protein [Schwartzia sp. (in: firmicutes)]
MKKLWIFLALTALFCLTGCGGTKPAADTTPSKKLKVVATIFPVYDWTRAVLGNAENVELTLLLGRGIDMHSYQPSAEDLLRVSTADVFLYVGGESDGWVKDALKEAANKDMVVVNLMEALGSRARTEERVEGMETGHEHGHAGKTSGHHHDHAGEPPHREAPGHDHASHHAGTATAEYDEHIWLSLKNAAVLTDAITDALAKADAKQAETYRKNAAAYREKLAALDDAYQKTVQEAPRRTLLFGDRFPFRYLTEDYSLTYYAAFPGCSAETEASFQTVAFLAGKLSEQKLPAILVIEGGDKRIAQAILQNVPGSTATILTLDSMQGTTAQDAAKGVSYLAVMEKNLAILKEALQ